MKEHIGKKWDAVLLLIRASSSTPEQALARWNSQPELLHAVLEAKRKWDLGASPDKIIQLITQTIRKGSWVGSR